MPSLPEYRKPAYVPAKPTRKGTSDQTFHGSGVWKRLRRLKLMQDPLCEVHLACEQLIDCTENSPVDHIYPISQGGAKTMLANLMTLCTECHNRKSALEAHGPLCDGDETINGVLPVFGGKEQVIEKLAKYIV